MVCELYVSRKCWLDVKTPKALRRNFNRSWDFHRGDDF